MRSVVKYSVVSAIATVAFSLILLGSSGVIQLLSVNLVSNSGAEPRWEPTSAVGSSWVTGWAQLGFTKKSIIARWNGGWTNQTTLVAPNGRNTGDLYVKWDGFRNRFVFVAIDLPDGNVWYGYSNDSTGSSWSFGAIPVLSKTSTVRWDFPSAVNLTGQVMVGAVKIENNNLAGFWTRSATNGISFGSTNRVGSAPGAQTRIVATNDRFHAFVPGLNAQGLIKNLYRYESFGSVWGVAPSDTLLFSAPPPRNESPDEYSPACPNPNTPSCGGFCPAPCGSIFYAPILDASGSTNGRWAVVVPILRQFVGVSVNNLYICTSDRGCGWINAQPNDQILGGVSSAPNGGYWVFYYTFHENFNFADNFVRELPFITQAIYFPPGQSAIGATVNTNIDPKLWALIPSGTRCQVTFSCFGAGDYQNVSGNAFAGASMPFVGTWVGGFPRDNDVFQSFVQDPQIAPDDRQFKPRFEPMPLGADLSAFASPDAHNQEGRVISTIALWDQRDRTGRVPERVGIQPGLVYPSPLGPDGLPWRAAATEGPEVIDDSAGIAHTGGALPFEPNFVPLRPGALFCGQPESACPPESEPTLRPGFRFDARGVPDVVPSPEQ